MNYFLYIILGFAPSIIWLLFYLRKDSHPESNRMIIKIFIYGMIAAVIAALIEIAISYSIFRISGDLVEIYPVFFMVLYHFLIIALIEEYLKYFVVREKVLKNQEFDEPVDAMLYMIIAALGFAALENILVLLATESFVSETLPVIIVRFIGATFLHALASGIVGYFLALSLYKTKKRSLLIISGLAIAILLHGIFNVSIIKLAENINYIIIPIIFLTAAAIFVSSGFRKLKKVRSVCKLSA